MVARSVVSQETQVILGLHLTSSTRRVSNLSILRLTT